MSHSHTAGRPYADATDHPVSVHVTPVTEGRSRLSVAFRLLLAIPHLILVSGPLAGALAWGIGSESGEGFEWSAAGGVYGFVIFVVTIVAWFMLVLRGRHPGSLYRLATHFLRWRVRANAYLMLLHDDYPPFGDGPYPAALELSPPDEHRDITSVLFRMLLVIPQLIALWALGIVWGVTTVIAWFHIVITGSYPEGLYRFGVGALRWSTRVEAYMLLLNDEYPPFTIGR